MLSAASFRAMGTYTTVAVEHDEVLDFALEAVRAVIGAVETTCSRFREDSELSLLNRSAGGGPVAVSPLLEEAIEVALDTAALTGGLVDPTVGGCLEDLGYTVTFTDLAASQAPVAVAVRVASGWRCIVHDVAAHTVTLPAGTVIDLGASGKAWAADRAARTAARLTGHAVIVDCGGDVSLAGRPRQPWRVRVADAFDADTWQDVHLHAGGLATSGPGTRTWQRGAYTLHHVIDPRSGMPAQTPWRAVSVAASTCVDANAASTAALLLGADAVEWLDSLHLPARLVDHDGTITRVAGWPAES